MGWISPSALWKIVAGAGVLWPQLDSEAAAVRGVADPQKPAGASL